MIPVVNFSLNENALSMGTRLKKIFDKAKKDQCGELFASFGVIALHFANPNKSTSQLFTAIGKSGPHPELAQFFKDNELLPDAKMALEALAIMDNNDSDSWGSFVEFCH